MIEQIDIVAVHAPQRSHHKGVTVVCDPRDYDRVLDQKSGKIDFEKRTALKVFQKPPL